MGKGLPTLADVAREAGCSRSTASNAYNRPDQLSVAVRQRVLDAAERLGYPGPDPAARQLRTGRTGTWGVLVLDRPGYAFSDPAAQLFLDGLAEELGPETTGLLLLSGTADRGGPAPEAVRAAAVDGFVSYCVPEDTPAIEAILARGMPFVTVDGHLGHGEGCVVIDNRGGQRAAVEHLLALGHRRLGVVAMPLRADGFLGVADVEQLADLRDPSSRDRLVAVWEALATAGVDRTAVPVAVARSSRREEGFQLARQLLDVEPARRPTALVAMSDVLALGCLDAARSVGLSVPRDLSVTGFDDIPDAALADPPLTSVHQDHALKGRLAGRLVKGLVLGSDERTATLPTRLVVRSSTGPAPG